MTRRTIVHLGRGDFADPVGELWLRDRSASFRYTRRWLRYPARFPLDPALPLGSGSFHTEPGRSLFGAFDDAAPDRWGRTLLRRAERRAARVSGRRPRALRDADFLLRVDDETRPGALRLCDAPDGPFLAPPSSARIPPLVALPQLLGAAGRVEEETETAAEFRLLLAPGSSLGGARPKASVRDRDGKLLIAKFPRRSDEWDLPAWEAVALSLARRAGILAASARLESVSGRALLLVRRFDRHRGGRIPFASAMTMLGASDREPASYPRIAEALRRHGAAPRQDLRELWRRIVFTVLISNRDDHLRNHGFLLSGPEGWRLAPAYDLNPVPADAGGGRLTTCIVEDDDRADLELARETSSAYGLSARQTAEIIAETVAAVETWPDVASSFGISPREQRRMTSAFVAGGR